MHCLRALCSGDDDRTLLLRDGETESDIERREASFVIETSNPDKNITGYHIRQLSTESN